MGTTPCILACSFSSFEGQQIYFTVMPHPSIKNEDANTHRVCGTNWGMRPLLIFHDLSQDSVEARHHGSGSASASKTILCQTPIRNLDSLDQDSGMLSCMSAILLVACQWHSSITICLHQQPTYSTMSMAGTVIGQENKVEVGYISSRQRHPYVGNKNCSSSHFWWLLQSCLCLFPNMFCSLQANAAVWSIYCIPYCKELLSVRL